MLLLFICFLSNCGVVKKERFTDVSILKSSEENLKQTKREFKYHEYLDPTYFYIKGPFPTNHRFDGTDVTFDNVILNVNINNQYYKYSSKKGFWPVFPITTYMKDSNISTESYCQKNEIVIDLEFKDLKNKKINTLEIPNIYIQKDDVSILPSNAEWKYRYNKKVLGVKFPLHCKDLDNTKLIIKNLRYDDVEVGKLELYMKYVKGRVDSRTSLIVSPVYVVVMIPVAITFVIVYTLFGGEW